MNMGEKAEQGTAGAGKVQDAPAGAGEIAPEWIRFWDMVAELNAEIDRREAKEAAQAATAGGTSNA